MDKQRKLEVLADCDFSLWRKIERAKQAGITPPTKGGFGNMLFGMSGAVSCVAENLSYDEMIGLTLDIYKMIEEDYSTVPFDEMDSNDPDFKFLFDYKEKLDELGRKIKAFDHRIKENEMVASNDWPEYNELMEFIGDLMAKDYRSNVLKVHGITYSGPTFKD